MCFVQNGLIHINSHEILFMFGKMFTKIKNTKFCHFLSVLCSVFFSCHWDDVIIFMYIYKTGLVLFIVIFNIFTKIRSYSLIPRAIRPLSYDIICMLKIQALIFLFVVVFSINLSVNYFTFFWLLLFIIAG